MLFSIIIPAYNAEKIISKCLDSVFKQDFHDFEVIVVNDASTDGTKDILRKYNIRQIVLEKNFGPAAARNVGIKNAQGDIIIFIDSDVAFCDDDALSKLKQVFDSRPEIDGAIMIKDKTPLNSGITPLFWAYYKYYLWNQPGDFQTSFTTERSAVKKYVFDRVGYFDDKYKKADVEDFEFGYRLSEAGYKMLIVRDIKVFHHFETFKQTTKKTLKRSWQWIRLFLKRKKFDPVYSSQERGVKTIIAAIMSLILIAAIIWPVLFWPFVALFAVYSYYNLGFYLFLIKEKKAVLILPFIILDIYICFLIALGAGLSIVFLYALKK